MGLGNYKQYDIIRSPQKNGKSMDKRCISCNDLEFYHPINGCNNFQWAKQSNRNSVIESFVSRSHNIVEYSAPINDKLEKLTEEELPLYNNIYGASKKKSFWKKFFCCWCY
jgi:hypothetical protein